MLGGGVNPAAAADRDGELWCGVAEVHTGDDGKVVLVGARQEHLPQGCFFVVTAVHGPADQRRGAPPEQVEILMVSCCIVTVCIITMRNDIVLPVALKGCCLLTGQCHVLVSQSPAVIEDCISESNNLVYGPGNTLASDTICSDRG